MCRTDIVRYLFKYNEFGRAGGSLRLPAKGKELLDESLRGCIHILAREKNVKSRW